MTKFELGELVRTREIEETAIKNWNFAMEVLEAFNRYIRCDWGDTCKHDQKLNDKAVKNNDDRIDDLLGGMEDVVPAAPVAQPTPVVEPEPVVEDDMGLPGLDDFGLESEDDSIDNLLSGVPNVESVQENVLLGNEENTNFPDYIVYIGMYVYRCLSVFLDSREHGYVG